MRYTPSDCFETFPFPQPDPLAPDAALEAVGRRFHEHRSQLLIARGIGLTPAQNLFCDPACEAQDIVEIRRLFVALDQAVLQAYGWDDIDLDHGFCSVRRDRVHYTIAQAARDELLRRLFDLNQRRYQEEVAQGLHDKRKKSKSKSAAKLETQSQPRFDWG